MNLVINGLGVGNREWEESRIIFQSSGLNNWADGVLFFLRED